MKMFGRFFFGPLKKPPQILDAAVQKIEQNLSENDDLLYIWARNTCVDKTMQRNKKLPLIFKNIIFLHESLFCTCYYKCRLKNSDIYHSALFSDYLLY